MKILKFISDFLIKIGLVNIQTLPPVETLPLETPKTKEEIINESLISIGQQISELREVMREYIVESNDSDVRAVGHIVSGSLEQTLVHLRYAITRFEKKDRLKEMRNNYNDLLTKVESTDIKSKYSRRSLQEIERQLKKEAILEDKIKIEHGVDTMNFKEFTEIYGE
jgi:hypothetical protein